MKTASYNERKKFEIYDGSHVLLYLNEQATELTNEETGDKTEGYSYTGDMPDGSTIIFDQDYLGEHRGVAAMPGPFADGAEAEKILW